ncbi:MAG: S49 family peptidase [Janthinobacterium lividum]
MRPNFRFASALLRDYWLIEATAAASQLPLVQALLDQAQLHRDDDNGAEEARQLDPLFGCFAVQLSADGAPQQYKSFDEAPAGSTAVLSIDGPILKDDFCDVGMNTKAQQIRTAYAHPNITAIAIKLDTPGGQSNAPALAADAIREARAAGVPVIGWVDHGMAASAGYWIGAACTELWLSQPTDQVGSIGAYQRVRKNGDTQVLEVYAPQSKQKNLPQRKAATGDTSLLEAELSDLVDEFTASVQADRGDKLNAAGDHFEGGLFMGKKAVAAGLADGICSFAQAVTRVQELAAEAAATGSASAGQVAPPSFSSDPLTPSLTVKYALLCALLGAATGLVVDKDKGSFLNEAQLDTLEAALAAQAAKDTELSTARTELATANTTLATTTTELTDTKGKLATAEKTLTTYAGVPAKGAEAPTQTGQDRETPDTSADDVDPFLAQVLAYKKDAGIPNKVA